MSELVREMVQKAKAYEARDIELAWEMGPECVRLSLNESPIQPSPKVKAAIAEAAERLNVYVPTKELKAAIARYADRPPEEVVVGGGSSVLIDACMRTFVGPVDEVVIPVPNFEEFNCRVELVGGRPIFVKMPPPDFKYDADRIINAITDRTKVVVIASPGNPCAQPIPAEDLLRISDEDVIVMLDGAYEEFATKQLSKDERVKKAENIVILRTFSKAFSLAGLRLGYALASPEVADQLDKAKVVWSLSMPACYAGIAALNDLEYLNRTVKTIKEGREYLRTELAKIKGLKPFPSETNFVLVGARETGRTGAEIRDALMKKNILIKDATNALGIDGIPYLRITVGLPKENQLLIAALRDFLGAS